MKIFRVCASAAVLMAVLAPIPSHALSPAHAAAPSLVIDLGYEPVTMDPQVDYDAADVTVLGNVYDTLVRGVGAKTVSIVPDLATAWKESPDGKTWTFTLRQGVKFHDGNPVDAAAVKFTFDRLKKLNQGAVGDFAEVASVDAPNSATVVFHLSTPYSAFLPSQTTLWGTGIVSPKTVLAHQVKGDLGNKWLNEHDAGSGPWTISQWVHNQKIVLTPFSGYWKGWSGSHVGEVVLQWPSASSVQRQSLEHGDVDIATNMTPQDFDAVAHESGIAVQEYTGQTIREIRINTSHGALSSKLVRQALAYSFDYDTMIKAVFKGHGARMIGVGPSGLANYIPAAHPYSYDPVKAKALLAQAGYPNGISVTVTWQQGDLQSPLMAEIWKADAAAVGITLTLQPLTSAQYNSAAQKASSNPDVFLGQWTMDYADDQQMYLNYFSSKSNPSSGNVFYFKNPTWNSLLDQAAAATSAATAKALYAQALAVIYDQALDIGIVQPNERIALRNTVHGFVYNFLDTSFYYDLYALSKD